MNVLINERTGTVHLDDDIFPGAPQCKNWGDGSSIFKAWKIEGLGDLPYIAGCKRLCKLCWPQVPRDGIIRQ